ncbi:18588_t:CDS:2 [Entrophospora sp. SA101]|nr:18588_t:CDS:2 [Entrophospora sp. SA101]
MTRRRHARTPAAISRRIEQHRLRHRALNLQGSVVAIYTKASPK